MKYLVYVILLCLILSSCSTGDSEIVSQKKINFSNDFLEIENCRAMRNNGDYNAYFDDSTVCYIQHVFEKGSKNCNEEEKNFCNIIEDIKNDSCPERQENYCYFIKAIGKKKTSECYKIKEDDAKRSCLISVGIANRDVKVCDSITGYPPKKEIEKDTCGNGICEDHEFLNSCYEDCNKEETHNYSFCFIGCNNEDEIVSVGLYKTNLILNFSEPILKNMSVPKSQCGSGGIAMCSCQYCFNFTEVNEPLIEIKSTVPMGNDGVCEDWITRFQKDDTITDYWWYHKHWIDGERVIKEIKVCNIPSNLIDPYKVYFPYDEDISWHPKPQIKATQEESYRDLCRYEIARKTNNQELCNLKDKQVQDECNYYFAILNENKTLCKNLDSQKLCEREIDIKKGMETNDAILCLKAGRIRYDTAECITKIAINTSNPSLCSYLDDSFGSTETKCFEDFAYAKKNITNCRSEDCFKKLATKKNIDNCKEIQSIPNKNYCYLYSVCKIEDIDKNCLEELEIRSAETIKLAKDKKDSTLCEELNSLKPICYSEFLYDLGFTLPEVFELDFNLENEDLCESLSGTPREKCYFNLALKLKDSSLCNYLETHNKICYESVMMIKNNFTKKDIEDISGFSPSVKIETRDTTYFGRKKELGGTLFKGFEFFKNTNIKGTNVSFFSNNLLIDIGCGNEETIDYDSYCKYYIDKRIGDNGELRLIK